jgi:demethylmenaquinone methyltransferase/2-methoxy-6-polyprenyl-1,4-benzoquinol methylase
MSATTAQLPAYYAARAAEYERIYDKPERQADLAELRRLIPAYFGGRTVLEIACGTGYWTRFLAPAAAGIVAIDSAEETLRIARERVPSANVSFAVGDAYAPERHGGPFDAAFAGFWFSHVPQERQAEFLAALNESLQADAKVVFLDNLFVEGSSSPISERDERGNTYQSRRLSDGSVHRVLKNFPSETQLHALVADGLGCSPRYTRWSYFWAFEYRVPPARLCAT